MHYVHYKHEPMNELCTSIVMLNVCFRLLFAWMNATSITLTVIYFGMDLALCVCVFVAMLCCEWWKEKGNAPNNVLTWTSRKRITHFEVQILNIAATTRYVWHCSTTHNARAHNVECIDCNVGTIHLLICSRCSMHAKQGHLDGEWAAAEMPIWNLILTREKVS